MQTAATTTARTPALNALAYSLPGRVLQSLAATAIVALAAHISIPLPFTPVPLTLQPLAVLGVGLALGPVTGFLTMLAYLLEGVCGLPVFSPTGPGGLLQFLGPTGGYLMAYPLVAALAGSIANGLSARMKRFPAALIAGSLAVALLFTCGALWFMHFTHHSVQATWTGAVAPFLPGEIVKVIAAAGIYSTLHRARRIQ